MKSVLALFATLAAVVLVADLARAAGEEACSYEDPDFGVHTHPLDIDKVRVSRSQETRSHSRSPSRRRLRSIRILVSRLPSTLTPIEEPVTRRGSNSSSATCRALPT